MLLFVAIVILSAASVLQEFLLVAVIYGIGFGALQTTIQTMAVRDVPHYRLGAANATLFTGLDLGMGIGVIVLGLIADRWGYRNMYLFTSGGFFCAVLSFLRPSAPAAGVVACRRWSLVF